MVWMKNKPAKPFFGDHKPVNLYHGERKIAGWKTQTKIGQSVSFENTYQDSADLVISGKTVQQSRTQSGNLLDVNRIVYGEDFDISLPGFLQNPGAFHTDYIPVTPGETYRFLGFPPNFPSTVLLFDQNKTYFSFTGISANQVTAYGARYLMLLSYYHGQDPLRDYVASLSGTWQIKPASAPDSYEAFVPDSPSSGYPSPLSSVGDYDAGGGKYVIPVTVTGRNLLDLFDAANVTFTRCALLPDGSVRSNKPNNEYCFVKLSGRWCDFFMRNTGKSVTFSVGGSLPDRRCAVVIYGARAGGGTYQLSPGSYGENSAAVSIAQDFTAITHIELRFNNTSSHTTDTTTIFTGFQLEHGEAALPYEPYRARDTQIELSSPLCSMEERSDAVDFRNRTVIRRVDKKTFDGTESFFLQGGTNPNANGIISFRTDLSDENIPEPFVPVLCTHLPYAPVGLGAAAAEGCFAQRSSTKTELYLRFRSADISSVANLKTWLAAEHAAGRPFTVLTPRIHPVSVPFDPPAVPTLYPSTAIDVGAGLGAAVQTAVRVRE